ncbi:MAG: hypothetical protein ACK55I_00725, partial [bacterium]
AQAHLNRDHIPEIKLFCQTVQSQLPQAQHRPQIGLEMELLAPTECLQYRNGFANSFGQTNPCRNLRDSGAFAHTTAP